MFREIMIGNFKKGRAETSFD